MWNKLVCGNKINHIIGLIGSSFSASIFREIYNKISGIRCPHIVWTKIWDVFGDPHNPPFPHDLALDYLIPLDDNNLPFDDVTLEELEYDVELEYLDDLQTSLATPTSPIEITHSSSIGDSLRTSNDSLQQVSNFCPN